jgi:uncharacterized protein (DUF58 family)
MVLPALGTLRVGRFRAFLKHTRVESGQSRRRPVRLPTAQSDVHGVRTYRSGDSSRWIHWRTTARRGELMVREYEEAPSENLILVLDLWAPNIEGSETREFRALEEAISLAATICREWCKHRGDNLVLAVNDKSPEIISGVTSPDFGVRALERLAVAEPHAGATSESLLEKLTATSLPAGPVLVITTRHAPHWNRLASRLQRPMTTVNASRLSDYDFYDGP